MVLASRGDKYSREQGVLCCWTQLHSRVEWSGWSQVSAREKTVVPVALRGQEAGLKGRSPREMAESRGGVVANGECLPFGAVVCMKFYLMIRI